MMKQARLSNVMRPGPCTAYQSTTRYVRSREIPFTYHSTYTVPGYVATLSLISSAKTEVCQCAKERPAAGTTAEECQTYLLLLLLLLLLLVLVCRSLASVPW